MKRKNRIRLSEAQLHNIIRESVKQVIRKTRLNEIGDTPKGAEALGALLRRSSCRYGAVSKNPYAFFDNPRLRDRWKKNHKNWREIEDYIKSHDCDKEAVQGGMVMIDDQLEEAMERNLWDIEDGWCEELPDDFDDWENWEKIEYFVTHSDWTAADWYAFCFGEYGDKVRQRYEPYPSILTSR